MKRIFLLGLLAIMSLALLSGCGKSEEGAGTDTVLIRINTEGLGQVAYAENGGEPAFDEEYPAQSVACNVEAGTELTIGAMAEEEWQFVKWTKDGEFYSEDETITVTAAEDTEYIAVFHTAGVVDGPTDIDLDTVTTMGEVLPFPSQCSGSVENTYVYVFEKDGIYYRAIAEMPQEVSEAYYALDLDDSDYNTKYAELIGPLTVDRIENLSNAIPSQDELDKLVGKTGQDLLEDDWYCNGYSLEDMEFYMTHGLFSYKVVFDGTAADHESFNEEEDIKPMVIKSVTFDGLGDATNPEYTVD